MDASRTPTKPDDLQAVVALPAHELDRLKQDLRLLAEEVLALRAAFGGLGNCDRKVQGAVRRAMRST